MKALKSLVALAALAGMSTAAIAAPTQAYSGPSVVESVKMSNSDELVGVPIAIAVLGGIAITVGLVIFVDQVIINDDDGRSP